MQYIVLVRGSDGLPMPIMDNEMEGAAVLFDSEDEAHAAGQDDEDGDEYGYKVVEWEVP